jgi:hypothetical protein
MFQQWSIPLVRVTPNAEKGVDARGSAQLQTEPLRMVDATTQSYPIADQHRRNDHRRPWRSQPPGRASYDAKSAQ